MATNIPSREHDVLVLMIKEKQNAGHLQMDEVS